MKKVLIVLLAVIMLCISTSCATGLAGLSDVAGNTDEVANPEVIGEMAGHSQYYRVHIKENDEYVPYFVVTSNYNNNTLLLREKPLDEKMQMNKSYKPNYYPMSDLDSYLNDTFINNFSDTMQDIINNTRVEVTTDDTLNINKKTRETEFITRKIFLLSASEWGIKSASAIKEGSKVENIDKFMPSEREWLRSTETYSYDTFWVVGNNEYHYENGEKSMCVRPVFTVPFDTQVEQSKDIIEGQTVYILTAEKPSEGKE